MTGSGNENSTPVSPQLIFLKSTRVLFILSISGRKYVQIFSAVVRSVLKKQVVKFWSCLRAIFFQENGTSCGSVHTTVKRSCLVVPTYHKKKFGKRRTSEGEIPKLLQQHLVAKPMHIMNSRRSHEQLFHTRLMLAEKVLSWS